jgi:hypothetical protein
VADLFTIYLIAPGGLEVSRRAGVLALEEIGKVVLALWGKPEAPTKLNKLNKRPSAHVQCCEKRPHMISTFPECGPITQMSYYSAGSFESSARLIRGLVPAANTLRRNHV